jgi:hypothetical protein
MDGQIAVRGYATRSFGCLLGPEVLRRQRAWPTRVCYGLPELRSMVPSRGWYAPTEATNAIAIS